MKNARHVVWGTLVFAFTCSAQIADWNKIFADLISSDRAVSDAARRQSFEVLIPLLESEGIEPLQRDISAIAAVSKRPDSIRLQVSALLSILATRRPDATEVFRKHLPMFISQFQDTDGRIQQNALRAVALMQPQVPVEAISSLVAVANRYEENTSNIAMYGLARCASTSTEAMQALTGLFSREQPVVVKQAAIRAIGEAKVTSQELIVKIIEQLASEDQGVVRRAVDALGNIGLPASAARHDLEALLASETDSDMKQAVTSALSRVTR